MKKCLAILSVVLLLGVGCSQQPSPPSPGANVDGSKFLLGSEPKGAVGVIQVRKESKDQDDVVIVGRIGGEDPWVNGRAAFTVVDLSLKSCTECGHDCATPWDY